MKWWGYLHVNGSIQVKRYFSDLDLEDAEQSPFVKDWLGPFEAKDREEAIKIVRVSLLGETDYE